MKKSKKLSPKQEKFCREYIIDLNATQAYIRAGYTGKGAEVSACKLLRNPKVQAMVQGLQKKVANKLEITVEKVLQERARLAFYRTNDLFNPDGSIKNVKDIDDNLAAAVHGLKIGVKVVKQADGSEVLETYIKNLKMMDKDKSLTALEKHLGIYEADNTQKGNADLKTRQEFIDDLAASIKGTTGLPKPREKK